MSQFKILQEYPETRAIRLNQREISYAQLLHIGQMWARELLSHFPKQEGPVGLFTQKTAEAYGGVLASWLSGHGFVPFNPKLPDALLRAQWKEARPCWVWTDSHHLSRARSLFGPEVSVPRWTEGHLPLSGVEWGDTHDERNLAYMVFTSGSTGAPKPIRIAHRQLSAYVLGVCSHYELCPGDTCSQVFDLSFDPAIGDLVLAWTHAATLVPLPDSDLYRIPDFIRRHQLKYWGSAPVHIKLAEHGGYLHHEAFPHLRYSTFIGEKLHVSLAQKWRKAAPLSTIENHYGPVEATISVARYVWSPEDPEPEQWQGGVAIGKPHISGSLRLEGGEIVIESPQVYEDRSPYFTGDLGYERDGVFFFVGRKDWQFKVGSQRIEPEAIESLLCEISGGRLAVVVPWPRDQWGDPQGIAIIVEDSEPWEQVLKEAKKVLPALCCPSRIFVQNPLPRNVHGKVDRKKVDLLGVNNCARSGKERG